MMLVQPQVRSKCCGTDWSMGCPEHFLDLEESEMFGVRHHLRVLWESEVSGVRHHLTVLWESE
eukprot:8686777-Prorocentrum_lima.AAC.1